MANFIKVQAKSKLTNELLKKVLNVTAENIAKVMVKAEKKIKKNVGNALSRAIVNTPVYRGLEGKYDGDESGKDLQAEFGLTNEMKEEATTRLREVVRECVSVSSVPQYLNEPRKRTVVFTIKALDKSMYYNKLVGDPSMSYESSETIVRKRSRNKPTPEVFKIEWMKWLLAGMKINSAIKDSLGTSISKYGIAFQLGSRGRVFSRSGRALMRRVNTSPSKSARALARVTRFPYTISGIVIPKEGDNFIDELTYNPDLRIKIRDIVLDVISAEMKTKARLIL